MSGTRESSTSRKSFGFVAGWGEGSEVRYVGGKKDCRERQIPDATGKRLDVLDVPDVPDVPDASWLDG